MRLEGLQLRTFKVITPPTIRAAICTMSPTLGRGYLIGYCNLKLPTFWAQLSSSLNIISDKYAMMIKSIRTGKSHIFTTGDVLSRSSFICKRIHTYMMIDEKLLYIKAFRRCSARERKWSLPDNTIRYRSREHRYKENNVLWICSRDQYLFFLELPILDTKLIAGYTLYGQDAILRTEEMRRCLNLEW